MALTSAIGIDEVLLLLALGLITIGLWALIGRTALLAPGLVLLWMVLPARGPLVYRGPASSDARHRRRSS